MIKELPCRTRAFLKKKKSYMTLFFYPSSCGNMVFDPTLIDRSCSKYIFVEFEGKFFEMWNINKEHLITVCLDELLNNHVKNTDEYDYLYAKYRGEDW